VFASTQLIFQGTICWCRLFKAQSESLLLHLAIWLLLSNGHLEVTRLLWFGSRGFVGGL